ncbi:MAG: 1,3-beta-galactosyl-N-acetylhexosamine phosphorylase [Clostridia bacterium]|nr:1,3-beta-galactosyl-N-acetylhexosamine phosphorylase [Clostridia bacterium]
MNDHSKGAFTLPGEAGYEELTLKMAEKWGADVIRDSDGTKLSDEITRAGYRIYSTICIIREHNAFAQAHPDAQQQSFLYSKPAVALGDRLEIRPLEGYFNEQFEINDSPEAMEYWQVWDRTVGRLLGNDEWEYSEGTVTLKNCVPFHRYSVSFLAWRVWEEINMYNHTTNHWTSEHLRQLDPRHPAAWEYLQQWLKDWCEANPRTDVVRLTSLFYNFVWIFGDDMRFRSRFVDWASYDFTVSPAALKVFEEEYGYALTAEDFINKGLLQATHRPPTRAKLDYMDFIQRFVAEKAKALVDIIHAYGKQAYVFYDDSWVGMEPCGKYFPSIGFDGLIKCVFSGFECRLCALAKVDTHELRFHPYLFPVGLGGLPTFSEGGEPEKDALSYWLHVRRALARQTVQRIGLGGYLHLTIGQDRFNDLIADIARDFRRIKALHEGGAPAKLPIKVAVMHYWGSLRSWTLSGHFHETDKNILIHINEALSGLPVDVKFVSFDDVKRGALKDVDVLINAGRQGDAWSGGNVWRDSELVSEVTRFVYEGGSLIGAGEPSAADGGDTLFALSHMLGVDMDKGQYACHASWQFEAQSAPFRVAEEAIGKTDGIRVTSGDTQVLLEKEGVPALTLNRFGKGKAVYMGGFSYSPAAADMLLDILKYLCGADGKGAGMADDPMVECAWFEKGRTLLVMNNADTRVTTKLSCPAGSTEATLEPFETRFVEM